MRHFSSLIDKKTFVIPKQKTMFFKGTLMQICKSPYMFVFIAARQGGFIVSYVRKIVVRKNITIFEGCHFPRFYINDLTELPENRDKEFQFGPMLF